MDATSAAPAVTPPVNAAPAAPSPPPASQADDARKRAAATEQAAARPDTGWMPMWGQYGSSTVIGHFYELMVGPHIRSGTEKLLGHTVDKPYTPTNTPGFLARELVYGIGTSYLDIKMVKALLKLAGHDSSQNMLTSASGAIGANGAITAGLTVAEAASEFRGILFRNAVITGTFAMLDALWGAKLGPAVESGVNRVLGKQQHATTTTQMTSNVPLNTVKQTPEQTARQFSRSFIATTTYTFAWQEVGRFVAQDVGLAIGGPGGAVAGAFAGAMATTMFNHVVLWGLGPVAGHAVQQATRGIETLLGMPRDKKTPGDVVPRIGDRVSSSVETAVIPFAMAAITRTMPGYVKGVVEAH